MAVSPAVPLPTTTNVAAKAATVVAGKAPYWAVFPTCSGVVQPLLAADLRAGMVTLV